MRKPTENKAPILITGGAGYLGSHMAALCLEKNVDFVVLDNLSNADMSNIIKLENHFKKTIPFFNIDLRDKNKLKDLFGQHQFNTVIHFAGLKSVSESVANPELYFENNVTGSENLIECIKMSDVNKVVFMSHSNAGTVSVPQFTYSIATGSQIMVVNWSGLTLSVTNTSPVIVNSADNAKRIRTRYSAATLVYLGSDRWLLSGDITI